MKPYTDIEQSRLDTMTQEEKAKRFDEAFKMAKEQHQYPWVRKSKDVLEEIFPELRESDDEKIRKWLIGTIKQIPDDSIEWETICKSDVLAWLDRPSEEKSDDKFVPKFHEGDWIDSFDKKNYQVSDGKGNYNYFPILKQDEMRLWTIEDAKPGDVLCVKYGNDELPFIYRTKTVFGSPVAYCGVRSDGLFISESPEDHQWCLKSEVQPASKEQRDLLFQRMKEAGYEWDEVKKELKKIETYNPYEAVVKSIAEMCKRYDRMNLDSLQDFYDNVKVKCKDAQEYDSLYPQDAIEE